MPLNMLSAFRVSRELLFKPSNIVLCGITGAAGGLVFYPILPFTQSRSMLRIYSMLDLTC